MLLMDSKNGAQRSSAFPKAIQLLGQTGPGQPQPQGPNVLCSGGVCRPCLLGVPSCTDTCPSGTPITFVLVFFPVVTLGDCAPSAFLPLSPEN